MEQISILIDGANFHHLALKKLGAQELEFDFEKFAHFLANGRKISDLGKRFYVGTVREEIGNARSKEAMARQTSLFTILISNRWEIKTSKLRMRRERIVIDDRVVGYEELRRKGVTEIVFNRVREKGIDVKIATDLIVGAIDNQYDTAVLVSSDADLIPAIDWVRRRGGKKVEYVGFSITDSSPRADHTKPLQTMIARTDVQRVLTVADLKTFIVSKQEELLFKRESGHDPEARLPDGQGSASAR